jgi:hypothetical protein
MWADAYMGFSAPAGVVLSIILGVGLLATLLLHAERMGHHGIRVAWTTFVAGVAISITGVAAFFTADAYYVPRPLGIDSRMNVAAQFGYVLVALAFFMFIGALAAALFRRRSIGVLVGAAVASIAVVTSVQSSLTSQGYWSDSWTQQQEILRTVNEVVPDTRDPATTIFTFGHPLYTPNWVPIFAQAWELDSALKVTRDQARVSGFPISGWGCVQDGIARVGAKGPSTQAEFPYKTVVFVNVVKHTAMRPADLASCERILGAWGTNPVQ